MDYITLRIALELNFIGSVLFDFFETLVEVDIDRPPMSETLTQLGYPCDARLEMVFNSDGYNGQFTPRGEHYGPWRSASLRKLAAMVGVPDQEQDRTVGELLRVDSEWTVKAKEGATELFSDLDKLQVPIGIASNWDYDLVPYLLQAGLPSQTANVTSADLGVRKPNPAMLRLACSQFAMDHRKTVYVGDNWDSDVTCALHAGLIPCWVLGNTTPAPRVVPTVRSLSDLLDSPILPLRLLQD